MPGLSWSGLAFSALIALFRNSENWYWMLMLHILMLISSCSDNTSVHQYYYSGSNSLIKAGWLCHNQLRLLGRSGCACTVNVECSNDEKNRPCLRCSIRPNLVLKSGPYPGIAPGGYSIHYTNTIPNPYPGANPG